MYLLNRGPGGLSPPKNFPGGGSSPGAPPYSMVGVVPSIGHSFKPAKVGWVTKIRGGQGCKRVGGTCVVKYRPSPLKCHLTWRHCHSDRVVLLPRPHPSCHVTSHSLAYMVHVLPFDALVKRFHQKNFILLISKFLQHPFRVLWKPFT